MKKTNEQSLFLHHYTYFSKRFQEKFSFPLLVSHIIGRGHPSHSVAVPRHATTAPDRYVSVQITIYGHFCNLICKFILLPPGSF